MHFNETFLIIFTHRWHLILILIGLLLKCGRKVSIGDWIERWVVIKNNWIKIKKLSISSADGWNPISPCNKTDSLTCYICPYYWKWWILYLKLPSIGIFHYMIRIINHIINISNKCSILSWLLLKLGFKSELLSNNWNLSRGRLAQRETVPFVRIFVFRPWFQSAIRQVFFKHQLLIRNMLDPEVLRNVGLATSS